MAYILSSLVPLICISGFRCSGRRERAGSIEYRSIWGMEEQVENKNVRDWQSGARPSRYFGGYCNPSHRLLWLFSWRLAVAKKGCLLASCASLASGCLLYSLPLDCRWRTNNSLNSSSGTSTNFSPCVFGMINYNPSRHFSISFGEAAFIRRKSKTNGMTSTQGLDIKKSQYARRFVKFETRNVACELVS